MGIFGTMRRALRSVFGAAPSFPLSGEGDAPASRDTLSAIHDLSRAVRNNPEAVDIYMALGNLFRSKGDIQHAVLIRERLIARPELDTAFKARASFELGQDYRRAGMVDRAKTAYREAARMGYASGAVSSELAGLFAESGCFDQAADEYGNLGHSLAAACYRVRHAEELTRESGENGENTAAVLGLLKKATRVYPGSAAAWSALLGIHARAGEWRKVVSVLKQAMGRVEPDLRFLLLEALYRTIPDASVNPADSPDSVVAPANYEMAAPEKPRSDATSSATAFAAALGTAVIPVLEAQEPGILLHYYGGRIFKAMGDTKNAALWFSKALVVQPHFWAARLELLCLAARDGELSSALALQLDFLAEELAHIKRFYCTACGLRQNAVFYRCPRCGRWHSISYRLSLQD